MSASSFLAKNLAESISVRGWVPLPCKDKSPSGVLSQWQTVTSTTWRDRCYCQGNKLGKFKDLTQVGILTGKASKLVVVDCDLLKEKDDSNLVDGVATFQRWCEENEYVPDTPCVQSGSGGRHYYYLFEGKATGLKTDKNVVMDEEGRTIKIDIRSNGGQIIAAGSIHPNGKKYEWLKTPEECGGVKRMPDWLLNKLKRKVTKEVNLVTKMQDHQDAIDLFNDTYSQADYYTVRKAVGTQVNLIRTGVLDYCDTCHRKHGSGEAKGDNAVLYIRGQQKKVVFHCHGNETELGVLAPRYFDHNIPAFHCFTDQMLADFYVKLTDGNVVINTTDEGKSTQCYMYDNEKCLWVGQDMKYDLFKDVYQRISSVINALDAKFRKIERDISTKGMVMPKEWTTEFQLPPLYDELPITTEELVDRSAFEEWLDNQRFDMEQCDDVLGEVCSYSVSFREDYQRLLGKCGVFEADKHYYGKYLQQHPEIQAIKKNNITQNVRHSAELAKWKRQYCAEETIDPDGWNDDDDDDDGVKCFQYIQVPQRIEIKQEVETQPADKRRKPTKSIEVVKYIDFEEELQYQIEGCPDDWQRCNEQYEGQGLFERWTKSEVYHCEEFKGIFEQYIEQCKEEALQKLKNTRVNLSQIRRHIEMEKNQRSICGLAIANLKQRDFEDKLDNHHELLFPICRGRVIDLKTKTIVPRTRDHYFTYESPVDYDPSVNQSFVWDFIKALMVVREGTNNIERMNNLLKILGMCLTGKVLRYFFLFSGGGKNGKSTLINVMKAIMGKLLCIADSSVFIYKKGADERKPALFAIRNARCVIVSEIPKNVEVDATLIKGITGGDPKQFRGNHRDAIEKKIVAKVLLAFNDPPKFPKGENPLFDRMGNIPFQQRFVESNCKDDPSDYRYVQTANEEIDSELKTPENLTAFFTILVDYAAKYLNGDQLVFTDEFIAKREELRDANDPFSSFMHSVWVERDKVVDLSTDQSFKSSPVSQRAKDFYATYCEYLADVHDYPSNMMPKSSNIGTTLSTYYSSWYGKDKVHGGIMNYWGIKATVICSHGNVKRECNEVVEMDSGEMVPCNKARRF